MHIFKYAKTKAHSRIIYIDSIIILKFEQYSMCVTMLDMYIQITLFPFMGEVWNWIVKSS